MEDQEAAPVPLYMFWEPFLGSRLDIWDVWTLQVAIVTALIFQGILTLGLICGLIYLRREFIWMRSDLREERQTYLSTGVVTSDAPRICATLLTEDSHRRHVDLKNYIRELGKELEEYKERFLTTQGLLVVLRNQTEPLLVKVPDSLRGIQSSLNEIAETLDETLSKYMTDLQDCLHTFEQMFQGQRDKIPDSLRRQNRAVEQNCTNLAASLRDIQSGFDGVVERLENKLTNPVSYICDTAHALDNRTADLTAWQQWVNQQITTINARLESLRNMIQDLPKPDQGQENQAREPVTTQDGEATAQDTPQPGSPVAQGETLGEVSQTGGEPEAAATRRRYK